MAAPISDTCCCVNARQALTATLPVAPVAAFGDPHWAANTSIAVAVGHFWKIRFTTYFLRIPQIAMLEPPLPPGKEKRVNIGQAIVGTLVFRGVPRYISLQEPAHG
jgi:hypothetical protein